MSQLACEGGRPVRPDFLVFGRPQIEEAEIQEVVDTLRSGWIGFGPKCLRFEEDFAAYTRAPHALSMNSATAALHLALVDAGVGPGDEVVTTPLTFCATANVIAHVGARPVFVDVDERTQNLDVSRIESVLSPRTKAIVPVHMCGWPCDMNAIGGIAERWGLTVIEDAAHAAETWYEGRKVGSISPYTAFSFYATKNMTTAEGGMLTVTARASHDRIKALFQRGFTPKRIAAHEDEIREIARDVLDRTEGLDECDLVDDVAQPFVARVIGTFMGLPPGDDVVWARLMIRSSIVPTCGEPLRET